MLLTVKIKIFFPSIWKLICNHKFFKCRNLLKTKPQNSQLNWIWPTKPSLLWADLLWIFILCLFDLSANFFYKSSATQLRFLRFCFKNTWRICDLAEPKFQQQHSFRVSSHFYKVASLGFPKWRETPSSSLFHSGRRHYERWETGCQN